MKSNARTLVWMLLAGLAGAGFFWGIETWSADAREASPSKVTVEERPIARDAKVATSFAPVVKKVAPSVVNIYTTKTVRGGGSGGGGTPFFDDPIFRYFFPWGEAPSMPRTWQERNLGSGVIVTEDGYILTNNHVIEGADEIKVATGDNRNVYTAKVVGTDPPTDIAVLKIEGDGFPAITMTDSDNLEVGDIVLAIGNPFGVGQTVTMGIVSAMGRGMDILDYEDFIQTDASINPGNSGGALVDSEGRLVGVNTAIISRSGGNQGIGFAVPINLARSVMDRLIAHGKVERGYLGVFIQSVTPDLAKEFNLSEQRGALVGGVSPDTPAERAGLESGDVIVEFNGKKVQDRRHLRLLVAQTAPGTEVEVKVIRDGEEKQFTLELASLSPDQVAGIGRAPRGGVRPALAGVELGDLDRAMRRQFGIPADIEGPVVLDVEPGSSAAEAGIQPGDVILEIDRRSVSDSREALDAIRSNEGDRLLLRVWSRGGSRYVVVNRGNEGP